MTRRIGCALAVLMGGALLVGCGSSPSFVRSQKAVQTALVAPGEASNICSMEHRTLLMGTEAYWAMTGVLPATETELVAAGLLLREVADFDLVVAAGDYQVVAVGDRCRGFEPDYPPRGTDGPDPTDPAVGSPSASSCEADRKIFEVAWEAYNANFGVPPISVAQLVPTYMKVESVGFDLVGTEIVPVAGTCD